MKKIIVLLLTGIILLSTFSGCNKDLKDDSKNDLKKDAWDGSVASSFEGGSGTKSDPYKIADASQLAFFAKSVNEGTNYSNKYIVFTEDIDLNNVEWTPIGNGINSFEGHFDGNEKTIKNLKITNEVRFSYEFPTGKESPYCAFGLFATLQDAEVKNLFIDSAEIIIRLSKNVMSTHAGILCGGLRTYDNSSEISNIKIQNSKIITDFQTESFSNDLCIGGAIGHIYSNDNTTTNINILDVDTEISTEKNHGYENNIGAIIGRMLIYGSTDIENCASYINLKINAEQYYYTLGKTTVGTIGASQASRFSVKNIFSKLIINKPYNELGDFPAAIMANAILGRANYYALKDDPTAVGYVFENVFGCVETIDLATGEKKVETTLYKLPEGTAFSQINCQGCEKLPENHGFDENIWDLEDLAKPKLK